MEDQQLIPRQGNYKKLFSYQKAEAIFDITYYFCHKYLSKGDRTIDQMVQAARSGKQNIVEGSAASSISKETEIKLISVAKASLHELLVDYEDYLRTRKHRQWEEDSIELNKMREIGKTHNETTYYMNLISTRGPETISNIAIVLIKQVDYLLYKHLQSLSNAFLNEGGFKEKMTRMRIEKRNSR
ncbi:MAG: four helix bundle protein [Bacteroidetes bacterium]|nr:four helix bundle protein [Bacteroidota bacterium]